MIAASDRSSRVLFDFSIFNFYREMLPVADFYHARGHEVHALIGYSGPTAEEAVEYCAKQGFHVHRVPAPLAYGDHLLPRPERRAVKERPGDASATLQSLAASYPLLRSASATMQFARNILMEIRPDFVFGGPFNSCLKFDNALAYICEQRHIPFYCLPVSAYVGERNTIDARFANFANGMLSRNLETDFGLVNKFFERIHPEWTRRRNGKALFMFDPVEMWAAGMYRFLEPNPWQKPSLRYDLVFVESEFSAKMLRDSDYPAHKVAVSGKPLLDAVFQNSQNECYKDELFRACGLRKDETFILFNVEPSAEHHYASWEVHWDRFESLMQCLARTGRKIVLSLHPLCDCKNYAFVEQKYGFNVARDYRIMDLYPHAGLVVSFPCSTNLLSLIFKKPLFVYDFEGLAAEDSPRRDLFKLPGVHYAHDVDTLLRLIQETDGVSNLEADTSLGSACQRIYETVLDRIQQT
jgi:hypothetical protein